VFTFRGKSLAVLNTRAYLYTYVGGFIVFALTCLGISIYFVVVDVQ